MKLLLHRVMFGLSQEAIPFLARVFYFTPEKRLSQYSSVQPQSH